jgi:hypothetical protein
MRRGGTCNRPFLPTRRHAHERIEGRGGLFGLLSLWAAMRVSPTEPGEQQTRPPRSRPLLLPVAAVARQE